MSRTGNCYDNAVMESWFGKFKTELGEDFESPEHAHRDVFGHHAYPVAFRGSLG